MAHDFYRTRERDKTGGSKRLSAPLEYERWVITTHGGRLRNVVLTALLVLAIGTLVGVIVYQQHLLSRKALGTPTGTSTPRASTPAAPVQVIWSGEWEPLGRVEVDDLGEIAPMREPTEGEQPPVTTSWVLQAARELRQAELAYRRGDWDAAIAAFQRVHRFLPMLQDVEARIGLCLVRKNDFENALAYFEQAIEKQPSVAGLWNNVGVARMAVGRTSEAEEAFQRALVLRPDHLGAARNLAVLKYRSGAWEEAVERLKIAQSLLPEDAEIAHMLALSLIRLERWDEAASLLREAVKRWPDTAPVRFRLAQALSHLNAGDEAMEVLRQGVQLIDPMRSLAWLSRSEFDRLRPRADFQSLVNELSAAR